MANVKDVRTKDIKLSLDKERTLRFDLNAFAELEEIYGSVQGAFEAMEQGSFKSIRNVLWAALVHEDDTLTVKQVGSLIGMHNLAEVSEKLQEAMGDAIPTEEASKEATEGNGRIPPEGAN